VRENLKLHIIRKAHDLCPQEGFGFSNHGQVILTYSQWMHPYAQEIYEQPIRSNHRIDGQWIKARRQYALVLIDDISHLVQLLYGRQRKPQENSH
jgi:hypothetical protein